MSTCNKNVPKCVNRFAVYSFQLHRWSVLRSLHEYLRYINHTRFRVRQRMCAYLLLPFMFLLIIVHTITRSLVIHVLNALL